MLLLVVVYCCLVLFFGVVVCCRLSDIRGGRLLPLSFVRRSFGDTWCWLFGDD